MSTTPQHRNALGEDQSILHLNLRYADTMGQGGIAVKKEDPAELVRWRELVAQVGREMAGPLTNALERVTDLMTTGKIDRASLRDLRAEIDQARQAGIWCQQIARLASGRVHPSQERIHLTNTLQSVMTYRHRELQHNGIGLELALLPIELQADPSMLFSLLNCMVDWWLSVASNKVAIKIYRHAWPERARLECTFGLSDSKANSGTPVLENLHWFVLAQTAETMGLKVERQESAGRVRLTLEFTNMIPAELPTLMDEACLDDRDEAINSKPLAGNHVLVIANNKQLRIQVREAVKAMGLVLDFVSNVREASEFCRDGLPHAILIEDCLQTAAFAKLAEDIRREVPEFVFIELIQGSRQFDISSVSGSGMARVGAEVIDSSLPAALIYELTNRL